MQSKLNLKFIILQLLSEKSKREAESRALSGEMETLKAKYEKKIETLNQGYAKLQGLLDKKEDQLRKQTESAQKASVAMKEELEQTVARHKVCEKSLSFDQPKCVRACLCVFLGLWVSFCLGVRIGVTFQIVCLISG